MSDFNMKRVFNTIEPSITQDIDAIKDIVNSPKLNRESFPHWPGHIDTSSGGGTGTVQDPKIWSIVPDISSINLGKFEHYNHKAKPFFMGIPTYIKEGDLVTIQLQFPDTYNPVDYTTIDQFTIYNVTDSLSWGSFAFNMDQFRSQTIQTTAKVRGVLPGGNHTKVLAVYISDSGMGVNYRVEAMVKTFTEGQAYSWMKRGDYPGTSGVRWCITDDVTIRRNFANYNDVGISYADYEFSYIGNIETWSNGPYKEGDKIRLTQEGEKVLSSQPTGGCWMFEMEKHFGRYRPKITELNGLKFINWVFVKDGVIEDTYTNAGGVNPLSLQ